MVWVWNMALLIRHEKRSAAQVDSWFSHMHMWHALMAWDDSWSTTFRLHQLRPTEIWCYNRRLEGRIACVLSNSHAYVHIYILWIPEEALAVRSKKTKPAKKKNWTKMIIYIYTFSKGLVLLRRTNMMEPCCQTTGPIELDIGRSVYCNSNKFDRKIFYNASWAFWHVLCDCGPTHDAS